MISCGGNLRNLLTSLIFSFFPSTSTSPVLNSLAVGVAVEVQKYSGE